MPDGLIYENNILIGIIEIKCPYSKRNQTIEEMANDKKFYLETENKEYKLKRSHDYFY